MALITESGRSESKSTARRTAVVVVSVIAFLVFAGVIWLSLFVRDFRTGVGTVNEFYQAATEGRFDDAATLVSSDSSCQFGGPNPADQIESYFQRHAVDTYHFVNSEKDGTTVRVKGNIFYESSGINGPHSITLKHDNSEGTHHICWL